jgi:uncharacterized tellurite resistance protein B-like protein
MLKALRALFDKDASPATFEDEYPVRIATAALLLEVTRVDEGTSEEERAAVLSAIRTKFGLSEEETEKLIASGANEARSATDYFEFTRDINRTLTQEQKLSLIEHLWKVAYADKSLSKYEDHLIRKVADLLYIPHSQVVSAKNTARDS